MPLCTCASRRLSCAWQTRNCVHQLGAASKLLAIYVNFSRCVESVSNNAKSKHLKGQLDPLSVTSRFLDQWRSVGPPCQWLHICWTKGGQLDPPVSEVTFFAPSWGPTSVTSRFLHQRSSVEPQCRWNVLQKWKKDNAKMLKFFLQKYWSFLLGLAARRAALA